MDLDREAGKVQVFFTLQELKAVDYLFLAGASVGSVPTFPRQRRVGSLLCTISGTSRFKVCALCFALLQGSSECDGFPLSHLPKQDRHGLEAVSQEGTAELGA